MGSQGKGLPGIKVSKILRRGCVRGIKVSRCWDFLRYQIVGINPPVTRRPPRKAKDLDWSVLRTMTKELIASPMHDGPFHHC